MITGPPDDKRYKKYWAKKVKLPWIGGRSKLTFIADKSVDPEFGTGAITLTPAHDFIDFDMAKKHKLEVVQIIGPDGNFTDVVGPKFAGKNARASRDAIVKILEDKDLLEKVDENFVHNFQSVTAAERQFIRWFPNNGLLTSTSRLLRMGRPAARPDGRFKNGVAQTESPGSRPQRRSRNHPGPLLRKSISTGLKICGTGAFPASCGGGTRFRSGTAKTRMQGLNDCSGRNAQTLSKMQKIRPCTGPRHAGYLVFIPALDFFDAWLAEKTEKIWNIFTRPRCWKPATTSSFSGSPA